MTRVWPLLILLAILVPAPAFADSSDLEGGVFIAHHPPGLQFTSGQDWCARYFQEFAIDSCSEQSNRIDVDGKEAGSVWYVLAAWGEEKEWCGAEFGFADFDSTIYAFTSWGPCFPDGSGGGLQIPTAGWPGPNAGVSLSISGSPWSGNFVPIYWFAGYAYYEGEIPLAVNPSSEFGGTANCEMPPETYSAAAFGGMGLFQDGVNACPEELDGGGGGSEGEWEPDGAGGYGGYEPDGGEDSGGAEWVDLGGSPGDPPAIQLVESDGSTSVFQLTIGGFYRTAVEIEGETYYEISLPGDLARLERCKPGLPYVPLSLIIPDEQRMVATVLECDSVTYADMPIAPSKGPLQMTVDPDTVSYCFDSLYVSNEPYPSATLTLGRPYVLRDFRGLNVTLNAFRALPTSGSLRIYTRLRVELSPAGSDTVNIMQRTMLPARLDRQFMLFYERNFLNYQATLEGRDYDPMPEDAGMLIIAADEYVDEVEPLRLWKRQRGLPTETVPLSAIGSPPDVEDIHSYILGYFNSHQNSYVLLVGDVDDIPQIPCPDWPQHENGGSDMMFGLLSGNDPYPEVIVGRFSGESTGQPAPDIATQVERSIYYESPDVGREADWLTSLMCCAGNVNYQYYALPHMTAIWNYLTAHGYAGDFFVSPDNPQTENLTASFNAGKGLLVYLGHGGEMDWEVGPFGWENVLALQNANQLPFIHAFGCNMGKIDLENWPCFGEFWLRSQALSGPIGAIGTYMQSREVPGMYGDAAQRQSMESLVEAGCTSWAGMCFDGCLWMLDKYEYDVVRFADASQIFYSWIFLGDPSLLARSSTASLMSVHHAGCVFPEQGTYYVSVRDEAGGGIAGACCALTDGETILGAGFTDATGHVALVLDPTPGEEETLTLTVTGRNRVTFVESVTTPCDPTDVVEPPEGPRPTLQARASAPSPFLPLQVITCVVPDWGGMPQSVRVSLFDLSGRRLKVVLDGPCSPGVCRVPWDGTDAAGRPVPAGVYYYRVSIGRRILRGPIVLGR